MNEVSDAAERHAESEVNETLKSLLRNLKEVRAQRSVPQRPGTPEKYLERQKGEVWGLDTAIKAVERRLQ